MGSDPVGTESFLYNVKSHTFPMEFHISLNAILCPNPRREDLCGALVATAATQTPKH